jgi:hypothetical protein
MSVLDWLMVYLLFAAVGVMLWIIFARGLV